MPATTADLFLDDSRTYISILVRSFQVTRNSKQTHVIWVVPMAMARIRRQAIARMTEETADHIDHKQQHFTAHSVSENWSDCFVVVCPLQREWRLSRYVCTTNVLRVREKQKKMIYRIRLGVCVAIYHIYRISFWLCWSQVVEKCYEMIA